MKEDKDIIKLNTAITSEDTLFNLIANLIDDSRKQIAKTVNSAMVYTYYGVGQYIVEFEQEGNARAAYGKGVLKRLSERLTDKFGAGWSVETLKKARLLFQTYSQKVTSGYPNENGNQWLPNFKLPWSHYIILMHEKNPQARSFYEMEAYNQQWSKRQLQRQIGSSLYERLALSRSMLSFVRFLTKQRLWRVRLRRI